VFSGMGSSTGVITVLGGLWKLYNSFFSEEAKAQELKNSFYIK